MKSGNKKKQRQMEKFKLSNHYSQMLDNNDNIPFKDNSDLLTAEFIVTGNMDLTPIWVDSVKCDRWINKAESSFLIKLGIDIDKIKGVVYTSGLIGPFGKIEDRCTAIDAYETIIYYIK